MKSKFSVRFSLLLILLVLGIGYNGRPLYDSDKGRALAAETLKVTFVELGSVNCIPCKMMKPVMDQVEKKYPGQVKVVFHDVWTEQGKAEGRKYNIRIIPTQVFLDKNGKEYFRHEGFFPFEDVEKVLKQQGVK